EQRIGERCQLHPPDTMRELLPEVGCDLKGKAGFAAASSASEGEQAARHEQPADRGQLAFAANKPVHLERQIVRRGVEGLRYCDIFHGMPSASLAPLLQVGYSFSGQASTQFSVRGYPTTIGAAIREGAESEQWSGRSTWGR